MAKVADHAPLVDGEKYLVTVTSASGPANFYCTLENERAFHDSFDVMLNERAKSMPYTPKPNLDHNDEFIYSLQTASGYSWRRARLIASRSRTGSSVAWLMDSGTHVAINFDCVYTMPEDLKSYPAFSFACSLTNLTPAMSGEEGKALFKNLTKDKRFEFTVVRRQQKTEGVLSENNGTSIGDRLRVMLTVPQGAPPQQPQVQPQSATTTQDYIRNRLGGQRATPPISQYGAVAAAHGYPPSSNNSAFTPPTATGLNPNAQDFVPPPPGFVANEPAQRQPQQGYYAAQRTASPVAVSSPYANVYAGGAPQSNGVASSRARLVSIGEPDWPPGTIITEAVISNVVSPDNFVVQDRAEANRINDKMAFLQQMSRIEPLVYAPVGMLCLTMMTPQQWYRARVLSETSVYLIDWGVEFNVERNQLYLMPQVPETMVVAACKKCALFAVYPPNPLVEEWPPASNLFLKQLEQQPLRAVLKDVDKSVGLQLVELFNTQAMSIASMMSVQGLAQVQDIPPVSDREKQMVIPQQAMRQQPMASAMQPMQHAAARHPASPMRQPAAPAPPRNAAPLGFNFKPYPVDFDQPMHGVTVREALEVTGLFYVLPTDALTTTAEVEAHLGNTYGRHQLPAINRGAEPGTACIVLNPAKGVFSRAVVQSNVGASKFMVLLVDYGQALGVDAKQAFICVSDDIVANTPAQAIPCRLQGLHITDNHRAQNILRRLTEPASYVLLEEGRDVAEAVIELAPRQFLDELLESQGVAYKTSGVPMPDDYSDEPSSAAAGLLLTKS